MRPVRIELEGFSAYRESETVDFEGVDFFSLSGPTGSGKSSLVDAMIFALYGRVPRLGGNAVAPAITAGTDRARVRFFFEVDDVVYDATRMAQRTSSGGATVKEARLQRDDEVLADGPGDVTAGVEAILRLGFEDFTRTVVLPQGDFARFLKATKSERQGLLRNLLGLDVYRRMRELARTRAAVASEKAENARRSLEGLEVPDDDLRESAVARRNSLERLAESLPDKEKALADLDHAVEKAKLVEESLGEALRHLGAIEPPPRLEELETLSAEARSRVSEAQDANRLATESVESAEGRLSALPSREQVAGWRKTLGRLDEVDGLLAGDDLEEARRIADDAESALGTGVALLESAREATLVARAEHAAHLLAAELEPGHPCPVCAQIIVEVPELEELPLLAEREMAETEAGTEVTRLRTAADDARARLAGVEASRLRLIEQREGLLGDLAGAPDDLESAEAELRLAVEEVELARGRARETEAGLEKARKEMEDLADASRQIVKSLTQTQIELARADLEPPLSESDDVAVQWKELILWRDETIDRVVAERQTAADSVGAAEAMAVEARRELVGELGSLGLEAVEPFAVQVATALQTARSMVEAHEKAIERSGSLAVEIEQTAQSAEVAKALADHLKANGFEQWLMSGALVDLVNGANDLLDQLSGGGYSLHSDESGSFSIIDHRNADEMRRVETLSGGETFLVSLALALSLAETLAAKGGSGLDAIILDEGFGTLDDESLDTVASVLEELTGKGLMVGVITHVKELAARAPVQYEVTKEPAGARVRKLTT